MKPCLGRYNPGPVQPRHDPAMASYTVIPRLDNRAEVLTVNRLEDIEEEAAVNERRESTAP
jgi:hypothetical protein